jgi:hypothetical protein
MKILDQLMATGLPMANWCSDIYIQVTPETTEIIKNYEFKCNVITFIDQVTGDLSYEIPFIWSYKDKGPVKILTEDRK